MTAEKKDRKPLRIKNLADLKRHIKLGTELVAMAHQYHPDIVGLTRVVTKVQTKSSPISMISSPFSSKGDSGFSRSLLSAT